VSSIALGSQSDKKPLIPVEGNRPSSVHSAVLTAF
jgi:hypothetical protein